MSSEPLHPNAAALARRVNNVVQGHVSPHSGDDRHCVWDDRMSGSRSSRLHRGLTAANLRSSLWS